MTNLSTEHTLIAAIPILVVLAVLSAAIIVFPKANLDTRSRAHLRVQPSNTPIPLPTTVEPFLFPSTSE